MGRDDISPGPFRMEPSKELFAGFTDGLQHAQAVLLNRARREFARFKIAILKKGIVKRMDRIPVFDLLPENEPDNPLKDEDDDRGWEAAHEAIKDFLLLKLRHLLLGLRRFMAGDGSVTTLGLVSSFTSTICLRSFWRWLVPFGRRVRMWKPDTRSCRSPVGAVV